MRVVSIALAAYLDLVGGAHGHRALVDYDLVVRHQAADIACRGQHILQVGRTILVGRRADGDELQRAMRHRALDVGRELQTTASNIALHDLEQPGFMDRQGAGLQGAEFLRASTSSHITWLPISARQAPVTRPT